MKPQTHPLQTFVAGDHWPGLQTVQIKVNGTAPTTALSSVRIRFSKGGGTAPVELTSATSAITISNAATWIIIVPKQAVAGLTAGRWHYQLKTTDAAGVVATWLCGEVEVLPTI